MDPQCQEIYIELSKWRKRIILFTLSLMNFAVAISSTSLIPAVETIASELSTTTELLNISNACVLAAMGSSWLLWGPLRTLCGRYLTYNSAIFVACVCAIGTASAPSMAVFTTMRVVGGFTGTFFMVSGQAVLTEIYRPVERGTAVGFFQSGANSGLSIGPCLGGLIVTLANWRVLYWVQFALFALGLILSLLFVRHDVTAVPEATTFPDARSALRLFNPSRVFRFLLYPDILIADLACGLLSFFQFALLTSAHSIFNPTFHLGTPLLSGLVYLAPGCGFLLGGLLGGFLSDRTTMHYIEKRNGVRLPRDRLNGGLLMWFLVMPISQVMYGWALECRVGGMAVPIVSAFFIGLGVVGSFNVLNTYTAEVLPQNKEDVMNGKYFVQYGFGATSSALVLPLIDTVGVGLTFTICAILAPLGGAAVLFVARREIRPQSRPTSEIVEVTVITPPMKHVDSKSSTETLA